MKITLDCRCFSLSAQEAVTKQRFFMLYLLTESLQIIMGLYVLFSSFCQKSHLEKQTESYANRVLVPVLFHLSYPLVMCTTLWYVTYSWLHYLSYQNCFNNLYKTSFFSCCLYCIYRDNSASFPHRVFWYYSHLLYFFKNDLHL